ncbi:hypothetical protein Tco_1220108 [Tanacetum coccineum]
MSTQQDIYAAGFDKRLPMLNKDNYVPWSSRLLRYAKSKPNRKLIYNSIINGPYFRRMIPEPGDPDHEVPIAETFHEQTNDELTKKEVSKWKLMIKPFRLFSWVFLKTSMAAVIVCETLLQKILRVQQMMKGSDIGIQDKKAKLFNEWERFTSTDGESIESYYHRKVNELRAERLARAHDPLALMVNSNTLYNYPVFYQDQPSTPVTYITQP